MMSFLNMLKDLFSSLFYVSIRTWEEFILCTLFGILSVCLSHLRQQVPPQDGAVLRRQSSETNEMISNGSLMLSSGHGSNLNPL